ncbi:HDOD domain-containing protein [Marinobacterium zhoushanense]|uniref:HDOD domain-containing protein n=1 Tax=Marinobacterium zhoushanense TaxID=1679163 RepID=A0ABQ1KU49_9GAMM|nr:HDOD domain-containing protein [Marinobacterium zhoushanense]GGC08525.1 HDOD domain-containing protein [Marinobacterium zhoushanense]
MEQRFSSLIPPQPEILVALAAELKREFPDQKRVAELLKADVALYSTILKAVNSPLYGLAVTVTSIERALSLLGFERIFNLVRLTILRNTLSKTGRLERFWDTAKDVATLSVSISQRLTKLNQDDAYTLGMLHDCGLPLMMQAFTGYREFLKGAGNLDPADFGQQEAKLFGFDHFQVGARMAERWFLPQYVADAIRMQPRIDEALTDRIDIDERSRYLLAVLTLAQDISAEYRYYWRIAPKQELSRLQPALSFLSVYDQDYLNFKDQRLEEMGA